MKKISDISKEYDALVERYPQLDNCREDVIDALKLLIATYESGGKLLLAGNGGSAADAEHMAGELMKRFVIHRPLPDDLRTELKKVDSERGAHLASNLEMPLTAIPLVAHEALVTAYMNDVNSLGVFAQQLLGVGRNGDALLAISTSGNSENIIHAAVLAKAMGIKVVCLTGENGGEMRNYSDITIRVPETETFKIQELHLPVYHWLCKELELYFFGE